MRDIKFKAWDTKKNQWLEMSGYYQYWVSFDGSPFTAYFDSCASPVSDLEDVILCQFTGLLDKNGKEIYEGDVVKEVLVIDGNFVEKITRKFKVIHQGVSFQYEPIPKSNHTVSPIGCEVEVSGNIYENPELIK